MAKRKPADRLMLVRCLQPLVDVSPSSAELFAEQVVQSGNLGTCSACGFRAPILPDERANTLLIWHPEPINRLFCPECSKASGHPGEVHGFLLAW